MTSDTVSYRRAAYQLCTYCSLWLDHRNQQTVLPQTESSVKIFLQSKEKTIGTKISLQAVTPLYLVAGRATLLDEAI